MAKLKEVRLCGSTTTAGAMTVTGTGPVFGRLYAVRWIDTSLDSCTGTISTTGHEASATLLTLTAQNASATFYPREAVCDNTGAALTVTEDSATHDLPLMVGTPRLVISSGGSEKLGGCILFYFED
jgi:hypothetical protein